MLAFWVSWTALVILRALLSWRSERSLFYLLCLFYRLLCVRSGKQDYKVSKAMGSSAYTGVLESMGKGPGGWEYDMLFSCLHIWCLSSLLIWLVDVLMLLCLRARSPPMILHDYLIRLPLTRPVNVAMIEDGIRDLHPSHDR